MILKKGGERSKRIDEILCKKFEHFEKINKQVNLTAEGKIKEEPVLSWKLPICETNREDQKSPLQARLDLQQFRLVVARSLCSSADRESRERFGKNLKTLNFKPTRLTFEYASLASLDRCTLFRSQIFCTYTAGCECAFSDVWIDQSCYWTFFRKMNTKMVKRPQFWWKYLERFFACMSSDMNFQVLVPWELLTALGTDMRLLLNKKWNLRVISSSDLRRSARQ